MIVQRRNFWKYFVVITFLSALTGHASDTVILNSTPNLDTGNYFNGQFKADTEGFLWFNNENSEWNQSTPNSNTQSFVTTYNSTYKPKIENSGTNTVTVKYAECKKWWGGSTSTTNVSDTYEFETRNQVQWRGSENNEGMHWRESRFKDCPINNHGEEWPYPQEGNRDVEFTIEVDKSATQKILTFGGWGVGSTITIATLTGVLSSGYGAFLGITANGIFSVAGLVASDNQEVVNGGGYLSPVPVKDGDRLRVRIGTVSVYYWRLMDYYPDDDQDGVADGPLLSDQKIGYYKDTRFHFKYIYEDL